jgi:DNA-directed RNA polymerase specialized sigma24 family protein
MSVLNFKSALPEGNPRRREDKAKEKVFLEHYSWLLQCALGITHGQRELAEDLVHDAFVKFLASDANLDEISDIRWYLNGFLRNLHLLHLRRAMRHPVSQFSLLDHDSVVVGLRSQASIERLQSADLLMLACDFACYRKESSLAAGILILRYFHGFYPGEICLLLNAKRKPVYRWIERGRTETKAYLQAPYELSGYEKPAHERGLSIASPNVLLAWLRDQVFHSCMTDCSVLAEYPDELGIKELAHLVSCKTCLERRGRKMDLAYVSQRMADDISDRDDGKPQGGGMGKILPLHRDRKLSKKDILRRVYARQQEIFEHRPKEISLAFDGLLRATLLVNAPTNTLYVSIDKKQILDAIAIQSEQEIVFLMLDRYQIDSLEPHVHRLALSDDRLLEVTVTPETLGPSIQIVYTDPLYSVVTCDTGEALSSSVSAGEPVLSFPSVPTEPEINATPGGLGMLLAQLRKFVPIMNPLLTGAVVLSMAAVLCFVLWTRSGPHISAHDLLVRAQKQETSIAQSEPSGVIVQRVRIKSPARTTERTLYRDIQRQRHTRNRALDASDAKLKAKLAGVGVDWDDPLSPVAYRDWRNREFIQSDSVQSAGDNLLTLTTNVNDGEVISESLTVRASDFHPVGKTVRLRDYGTIEIAEVNYSVLPWDVVNPNWFEPAGITNPGAKSDTPPALLPRLPVSLTDGELDGAELSARLVLNQLHADTGEQIETIRDPSGIVVKGIVETEQRRHELDDRLYLLPHVTTSISSIEGLKAKPSQPDELSSVKVIEMQTQTTPLETYYLAHGRSVAPLGDLAQRLFNSADAINFECRAIDDLQRRFSTHDSISLVASATLADLLFTHKHKLIAALENEEQLLATAQIETPHSRQVASTSSTDLLLAALASRNLALIRELAMGRGGSGRSAAMIASELAVSMNELNLLAHEMQVAPQNSAKLDRKK